MRTITFDLSAAGIDKALAELEQFKKDFIAAADAVIRELSEDLGIRFQIVAIANLNAVGKTGGLSDGADGVYDPKTRVGIVTNKAYYAVFVEYGTGVVGSHNAYIGPATVTSVSVGKYGPYSGYDQNHHGEEGWIYKDSDGKRHWTAGQPSRPFFYTMMRQLADAAPGVAERIFNEKL